MGSSPTSSRWNDALARPVRNLPTAAAVIAAWIAIVALPSPARATDPAEWAVTHSIRVRIEGWLPLPTEEVRYAAGATALRRLTDATRVVLADPKRSDADADETGTLDVVIRLIGHTQQAKLKMTLDLPGKPQLASTAAVAMAELEPSDVFAALEHLGTQAADRMILLVDAMDQERAAATDKYDAAAIADLYKLAQTDKRAGRFAAARAAFESIAASKTTAPLAQTELARDELRYGLPIFEVRQLMNQIGRLSRPDQQAERVAALDRAEALLSEIQNENPGNLGRVAESQRALDDLVVMRSALSNALRASALSRAHPLRILLTEQAMMEGVCPNRPETERAMAQMGVEMRVVGVALEGRHGRRYTVIDPATGIQLELACDRSGVTLETSRVDGR